jgi:hypothetical protein
MIRRTAHQRQLPLHDLMLAAHAELRANPSISRYIMVDGEVNTLRACPNCKRHTATERVPATFRQVHHYKNGTTIEQAAPPYDICMRCGWMYGYIEDAEDLGAVREVVA